jgi:diaminopimelate decarboxylase
MAFIDEFAPPQTRLSAEDLRRLEVVVAHVSTPALIYDLDRLTQQVADWRAATVEIPQLALCFAVKANRHPEVLRHLASLGLGADVASLAELAAAQAAGMSRIVATAPGWHDDDFAVLATAGVTPDCDSVSQVAAWGAGVERSRRIGLRLRTRGLHYGDKARRRASRFGVSPESPGLSAAIERYGLRVGQLHVHTDVWVDEAAVGALMMALTAVLQHFPDVDSINLGGGMGGLYAAPDGHRRIWRLVGEAVRTWEDLLGRSLQLLVEPGLGIVGAAGYLVATVVAVNDEPDGSRLATLDASGWNLFPWEPPTPVLQFPRREGANQCHDLAGNTCNEADFLANGVMLAPLAAGDRVVFSGAGAYTSSMYRESHGLAAPDAWILAGDSCRKGGST